MDIIAGIKRRLHRDIVADPVLHGLVLNLYLNGEQYPHRVSDYFPFAAVHRIFGFCEHVQGVFGVKADVDFRTLGGSG